jgi:long-chain acyl-CoA synthetase
MSARQRPEDQLHTLGEILGYHAECRADAEALAFEGRRTTYGQFHIHANQIAHGIAALGLQPTDHACFLSKNSDTVIELAFGCARGGFVLVGINWRLLPEEIAYILRDCGAKVLFVSADFFTVATRLVELLDTNIDIVALDGQHLQWPGFDSWREKQPDHLPEVRVSTDDVALMMYTSGTTGYPKGVRLTHRGFFLLYSIEPTGNLSWVHWLPSDSNLVAMPCFHVGGIAYAIWSICGGSRQVILREFEAGRVLRTIEEERITRACIVSTAIRFCLDHPASRTSDLSTLKYIQYGGSAMSETTLREALEVFKCGFVQNYGMTETTGAATYLPSADHGLTDIRRLSSVGMALPGVDLKIVDTAGAAVKRGEVGEICINSPANMKGYWNLPTATAKTLVDGFVHTGDAGYLDDDGYLYVVDRIKDLIISGGENVSSLEVEHAILKHPAVSEAAVIGVPDRRWGEAVKAIIVLRSGMASTAEDIVRVVRTHIAPFKCPKSVEFVERLPRNASGKLLKRQLRTQYSAAAVNDNTGGAQT